MEMSNFPKTIAVVVLEFKVNGSVSTFFIVTIFQFLAVEVRLVSEILELLKLNTN
jgi:hypothetical protein